MTNLYPGFFASQIDIVKEKVLILTWKQPFASLMLHGKIETRRWKTKYKGLVLIHAALKPYNHLELANISTLQQIAEMDLMAKNGKLDLTGTQGKIIAIGRITECWQMRPLDSAKTFTYYNGDFYCHKYENVLQVKPIEWKGKQGWANAPVELLQQIEIL